MKIIIALAAALLASAALAQNAPPPGTNMTAPAPPRDRGSMDMGDMHRTHHGMDAMRHHSRRDARRHHHRMMRHHHRMVMRHHRAMRHHARHAAATTKY